MKKNNKSIAILLGVFNGGKYLQQQIESLLSQTNPDWTLFIRDDGSEDNSIEIIEKFCLENKDIFFVKDDKGNLGSKNNFFELLQIVDSKYYMFCDQDDFWLPKKIELTIIKMKEVESLHPKKPVIIHTDLIVVDENLLEIAPSFWKYSKISPDLIKNFEFLAVYNLVTGCSMMFNNIVKEVSVPLGEKAQMHDIWISLQAIKAGGIIESISEKTLLYRQHKNNVIGASNVGAVDYFLEKSKNLRGLFVANSSRLSMVREIQVFGTIKYLFYKTLYILRR